MTGSGTWRIPSSCNTTLAASRPVATARSISAEGKLVESQSPARLKRVRPSWWGVWLLGRYLCKPFLKDGKSS